MSSVNGSISWYSFLKGNWVVYMNCKYLVCDLIILLLVICSIDIFIRVCKDVRMFIVVLRIVRRICKEFIYYLA